MVANRIQKNPVSADNMGHLVWAQALRVVAERRDVHWSEAERRPRVQSRRGGILVSPPCSRTEERTHLDDVSNTQHGHCLQVVFTPSTILVFRARSITLYDSAFTRITTHSFGRVDNTSATPTSILIRSYGDNPWASEPNSLELYSLSCFPPTLTNEVSSRRGPFRCTDIILGKQATAVWIRPCDPAIVSRWEERDGCEALIAAVFSGPLNPTAKVRIREVCMNTLSDWTVFDYDEDLRRIALGSGFGKITIVQL